MKKVIIDIEQYECLRGHLETVTQFLNNCVAPADSPKKSAGRSKPKMNERVDRYKLLIGSGVRARKPDHFKK